VPQRPRRIREKCCARSTSGHVGHARELSGHLGLAAFRRTRRTCHQYTRPEVFLALHPEVESAPDELRAIDARWQRQLAEAAEVSEVKAAVGV
jgi:hypothetical protein